MQLYNHSEILHFQFFFFGGGEKHAIRPPLRGQKRTFEANLVGDNSSFSFTVCVKSVPLYHFKLAHVVLHVAVKDSSAHATPDF